MTIYEGRLKEVLSTPEGRLKEVLSTPEGRLKEVLSTPEGRLKEVLSTPEGRTTHDEKIRQFDNSLNSATELLTVNI